MQLNRLFNDSSGIDEGIIMLGKRGGKKNKGEIAEYINKRKDPPASEYEFAEQIIQSKIALEKNYKPVIKLDDPISRQMQVLLEKLDYSEGSNDFWMQYYVPIYRKMFTTGKFEYLVNYIFSEVDVAEIKKFNVKNKKEIQAMIEEMVAYFNKIRSTRELNYNKRNSSDTYYYYVDGKFSGSGKVVNNGEKFVGDWVYYYPGGKS